MLSSLLSPTYKLSRKNTQPENTWDINFEKANGCGRTVNRASVLYRSSCPKGYEKGVMKNFAEFTRKHLYGSPFLVFSCEFCKICKICKNTFLAEQHQTTASDYSSINSSEGSSGERNCEL